MCADIEILKDNFSQIKINRIVASWALLSVNTSNICVSIFNQTKEGNIFNICRESLYLRCIIETRKILEPYKAGKTINLDYVIKQVYKNKDYFIKEHYNDCISIKHCWCGSSEEPIFVKEYIEERNLKKAKEAQHQCLHTIELVKRRWDQLWGLMSHNSAFTFLREKRDICVHSIKATNISMPPVNKMRKLLNLIIWFIKKLDFIIHNTSSNPEELDDRAEEVAIKFWKHIY